jgi:hypothetical protein
MQKATAGAPPAAKNDNEKEEVTAGGSGAFE